MDGYLDGSERGEGASGEESNESGLFEHFRSVWIVGGNSGGHVYLHWVGDSVLSGNNSIWFSEPLYSFCCGSKLLDVARAHTLISVVQLSVLLP